MSKKVTIMAEQNGKELATRIQNNIQKVLVGKEEVTELLLTALIADGHVLSVSYTHLTLPTKA